MRRLMTAALVLAIVAVACGGDDSGDVVPTDTEQAAEPTQPVETQPEPVAATAPDEPEPTAAPAEPVETTEPVATTEPEAEPELADLRSLLADRGIDTITIDTTEGGSHPTLTWTPIDGASTYWVVLRDSAGQLYWAWTGSDTSVRVGGGDSPDLNQTAVLHEPMTWSVAAFDADGNALAFSPEGELTP
jgi:hypothetical protein